MTIQAFEPWIAGAQELEQEMMLQMKPKGALGVDASGHAQASLGQLSTSQMHVQSPWIPESTENGIWTLAGAQVQGQGARSSRNAITLLVR